MFVRWQWWDDRKRTIERWYHKEVATCYAILVESVRLDGKPRQRHIAYLGPVHEPLGKQDPHYRAWWWHGVKAKLDRFVGRAEHPKIEAQLATKVPPPPTPAEVKAHDLAYQRKTRREHFNGEDCPGCYLDWPKGTKGVPPRPKFPKRKPFARVLAAVGTGGAK